MTKTLERPTSPFRDLTALLMARHQEEAEEYLNEPCKLILSERSLPFRGMAAQFAGRRYEMDPGDSKIVRKALIYHLIGDPHLSGSSRRRQASRLKARYGNYSASRSVPQEDLKIYYEQKKLVEEGRLDPELAYPVPDMNAPVPIFEVADVDNDVVFDETNLGGPPGFPLYFPEWEHPDPVAYAQRLEALARNAQADLKVDLADSEERLLQRIAELEDRVLRAEQAGLKIATSDDPFDD